MAAIVALCFMLALVLWIAGGLICLRLLHSAYVAYVAEEDEDLDLDADAEEMHK